MCFVSACAVRAAAGAGSAASDGVTVTASPGLRRRTPSPTTAMADARMPARMLRATSGVQRFGPVVSSLLRSLMARRADCSRCLRRSSSRTRSGLCSTSLRSVLSEKR